MGTTPFLVRFAKTSKSHPTSQGGSGPNHPPFLRESVTPQPPSTLITKVNNETTDDT